MTSKSDLLRAALLWNVPVLNATGDEDARRFTQAMRLHMTGPSSGVRPDKRRAPLFLASTGLELELSGRTEQFPDFYSALREREGTAGLLGDLLWVWSSCGSPADVEPLIGRIGMVEAGVRPNLLCKLLAICWTQGWHEIVPEVFRAAYTEAVALGENTTFAVQLVLFAANELNGSIILPLPKVTINDELAEQPWVTRAVSDALARSQHQNFEDHVSGPYTRTFRLGGALESAFISADMQATWAGLVWRLREIKKTVSEQLILSGDPASKREALAAYLFSRSARLNDVARAIEPALEQDASAMVEMAIDKAVAPWHTRYRDQAFAAFWDIISDGKVQQLIEGLPVPESSSSPEYEENLVLLQAIGRRNPQAWWARYRAANAQQRRIMMAGAAPLFADSMGDDLGDAIRKETLRMCRESDQPTRSLLITAASFAKRVREFTADAVPTWLVASLALEGRPWLSKRILAEAEQGLWATVEGVLSRAQQGQYGFGGDDPVLDYARVLVATRSKRGTGRLVRLAVDNGAPSDTRISAMRGLAMLARMSETVSDSYLPTLLSSSVPTGGPVLFQNEITDGVYQTLRDCVILLVEGEDSQLGYGGVVSALKSASADGRAEAAATLVSHLKRRPRTEVAIHVYSALFDPEPIVVGVALSATALIWETVPSLRDSMAARLVRLFENSERQVRANVIRACGLLVEGGHGSPDVRHLFDLGRGDRSWFVREQTRLAMNADLA
jgi:hypothetical protein